MDALYICNDNDVNGEEMMCHTNLYRQSDLTIRTRASRVSITIITVQSAVILTVI